MNKYKILFTGIIVLILCYAGIRLFFSQIEKKASAYVGDYIPDTALLDDGRYIGHVGFLNNRLEARVEFIIEDHRLVGCNFEELFGTPGHQAPYLVKQKIDQTGKLDFDAVSGATMTDHLARAAIKNAIDNGPVSK